MCCAKFPSWRKRQLNSLLPVVGPAEHRKSQGRRMPDSQAAVIKARHPGRPASMTSLRYPRPKAAALLPAVDMTCC